MASWTEQDTNSLLPGQPWTSAKVLAAFENPVAIAEGATNAPIAQPAWHGYDITNAGQATSAFYTGDAVSTVETPNFADGYEYRILGRDIEATITASNLQVDLLINSQWETVFTSTGTMGNGGVDFDLWIRSPRRSARRFMLDYSIAFTSSSSSWGPTNGTQENGLSQIADNNEAVVTRARVLCSSGNIDGGEMYLLRRREF